MCEITKAENFRRANEQSPVVYGSVLTDPKWRGDGPPPSQGVYYRLADGTTHKLGIKAVRALGDHKPRWAFEDAYA